MPLVDDKGFWQCPACGQYHHKDGECVVMMNPVRKQKIRVITSFGGWFDMDGPPNFSLPVYVQAIRATGYALNDTIYVPHDHIVSIFVFDPDAEPKMPTPMGPPMPPHGSRLQ